MQTPRFFVMMLALSAGLAGCGSDSPSDPGTDPNNGGNGRTMTATFNGTSFRPTLMTSAYLANTVSVSANDGSRSLLINANGITAPGTFSFAAGNSNSAIVQWIDGNVGTFSTGFSGANGGTVTFTVLQLGRVAGSFNVVARNTAANSTATMALVGTFDIKFP